MRHELNVAFMSLTSLIDAKFTAHPQMDVEEPNQNAEQEQRNFAYFISPSIFFTKRTKASIQGINNVM